jgi:LMBR1-like membrane protein
LRYPDLAGQRDRVGLEGRTLNEDVASSLTRRARNAQRGLAKAQMGWLALLRRAGYLYDLKAATTTSGKRIEWKLSSPGRLGEMIPANVQYVWFLDILPWSMRVVSVLVRVVSISIVWSEIVHNWTDPPLSLVGIVIRATGEKWLLMEVARPPSDSLWRVLMVVVVDIDSAVHGVRDVFEFYETPNLEYVQSDAPPHRPRLNPLLRLLPLPSDVPPPPENPSNHPASP